ncbi:unnamed protein product, partial [Ectocarpus sp. 8 AP-2014]
MYRIWPCVSSRYRVDGSTLMCVGSYARVWNKGVAWGNKRPTSPSIAPKVIIFAPPRLPQRRRGLPLTAVVCHHVADHHVLRANTGLRAISAASPTTGTRLLSSEI